MMKAFLFDLNGTMIDDMDYHTDAWHEILNNDLGANLSREQVKKEMYGKNHELLVRVFGDEKFTEEEKDKISFEKERRYQSRFKPHLKLINGLAEFLKKAHDRGIKMAIGSAAITSNVDFVLDGVNIREYFPVVISADNVSVSKPDPETFLKGAEQLGINPEDCIVFEDNPNGVEAARRAGMKCVVLTTMHEEYEFTGLDNILVFVDDYEDPFFEEFLK
nr:HAD family phosphatase [Pedobacter sp. SYSU D00823]